MQFIRITSIIFNVIFLLSVIFSRSWASQPLHLAYPEFSPFHTRGRHGHMQGFFYEIITEAIQNRLGVQVIWTSYPWIRCQENVRKGHEDAILTTPTATRAQYTLTHARPFWEKNLHVFTSVNHPRLASIMQIHHIQDIAKRGFSVITYSGNGWHETNITPLGIQTYETSNLKSVWQMLSVQRGDLVIEWPYAASLDILDQGKEKEIVDTGITIGKMPFHLLIRKDSPHVDLLNYFDGIIDDMRRDGTMDTILKAVK